MKKRARAGRSVTKKRKKQPASFDIEDCLHNKKALGRAECGLVVASYFLSDPKKLRDSDKERIQDGLVTAKRIFERMGMAPSAPEALKKAVVKARRATAKAENIIKNATALPTGGDLAKLNAAVSKAHKAYEEADQAAGDLCRKGRS